MSKRRSHRTWIALVTLLAATPAARAQLIQVKTLPVADGDQWRLFPSANYDLGGVSIAMRESMLDPFVYPAKGSRLNERSHRLVFGSPSFYSLSKHAGGG